VSTTFGEWYQKTNNTEDTNIKFIGLQNKSTHRTPLIWRLHTPVQGSAVGGLLTVSLPEEHHERRTFCRCGGNPRTCDSSSVIDS
jgi:hypothetical protein